MGIEYKPYYYQTYAENFIIEHKSSGLLLDMGMGKSVITLTAVDKLLYDLYSIRRVLIIAPLAPAKETWPNELNKWNHLNHLTYSLVLGSKAKRISALNANADIYIINRENVSWLVEYYKRGWPFDMVVIDELSSFKSSKARRFRELKMVRKYISRIVGLTGTPSPNGLLDLWPQIYLLDCGESLGKTITGFRNQYFKPEWYGANVVYTWRPIANAEVEIYDKLKSFCVSMKSSEYLKLPDRLDIRREVILLPKAMRIYKNLERTAFLAFEDGNIDGKTAVVLANKLLQAAGGAAYTDNDSVRIIHNDKLEVLDELIEDANGLPVLIFYAYKHERDRIAARFPSAVDIKNRDAVAEWNKGKIQILLAHPASAGHGLNLQFGGHIIIWFGLPYSLELYQQANKRLHRIGQANTVLIHHLIAKNTLDEYVLDKVLSTKEAKQNALLDALKAKIQEVRDG